MRNSITMMAVGILMVCLLPLTALAQQQEWQSTSTMQGSGSAYSSQVTAVGATGVNSLAGTAASAPANAPTGPRRVGSTELSDPNRSNESPIGDAVLPLMLCAGAYLIIRARKRMVRSKVGEKGMEK